MTSRSIAKVMAEEIDSFAARLLATHPLMKRARAGEVSADTVALYLVGVRYLLQHSTPHLVDAEKAATRVGAASLAKFFRLKEQQEAGHDRWADADLNALVRMFGVSIPAVPSTMREHVRYIGELSQKLPEHYLVYIFFAELVTVLAGAPWVRALIDHCGIPEGALTVVSKHVELDVHHVAEGVREIDSLLSGDQDVGALIDSLHSVMDGFDRFLDQVHEAHPVQRLVG